MSDAEKEYLEWWKAGFYDTKKSCPKPVGYAAWCYQQAIIDDLRKQLPPAEPNRAMIEAGIKQYHVLFGLEWFNPDGEGIGHDPDSVRSEVISLYKAMLSAIGEE